MNGATKSELRSIIGLWNFIKYRDLINMNINDYPDRKICPKCHRLYHLYNDECNSAGCRLSEIDYEVLIPFKEYQKTHPTVKGIVIEED
jgi:hypothetical protein